MGSATGVAAEAAALRQEFGTERDALSASLLEAETARSTAEGEVAALRERWVGW